VADYFEESALAARGQGVDARTVCNWVIGELFRFLNETGKSVPESPVTPQALADLLARIEQGTINVNTGKSVLGEMLQTGQSAGSIIAAKGLAQISDTDALDGRVNEVVQDNPEAISQYLAGKETVFGFLMGQVMRATRGKANPQIVRELLHKRLDALRDD
jgi:aspartyl-tRNA(Asn)/glutamyl-tRNA(Gln) amidotransferase subunit B